MDGRGLLMCFVAHVLAVHVRGTALLLCLACTESAGGPTARLAAVADMHRCGGVDAAVPAPCRGSVRHLAQPSLEFTAADVSGLEVQD